MTAPRLAALALTLGSLAACASGQRAAPPGGYVYAHSTTGSAQVESVASTSAPPSYDGSARAQVSQDAPSPAAPSGAPVNVPATVRPGLATEWGETRYSAMSYAPFVRGAAEPHDVASIFYNDARLAAMQALAHQSAPVRWAGMYRDGVRVSLRDEDGDALPGYPSGDRMYVLGRAGQRYAILVENNTPARFEAVLSVDGLDVISGQPASFGRRGYILNPYSRIEVEGFRQSADAVATFRFGSVGDSYAAQQGDARNVGVIGVALFAERGAALDLERNEVELRERANPFPGGFATPPARRNYY